VGEFNISEESRGANVMREKHTMISNLQCLFTCTIVCEALLLGSIQDMASWLLAMMTQAADTEIIKTISWSDYAYGVEIAMWLAGRGDDTVCRGRRYCFGRGYVVLEQNGHGWANLVGG
jgi:hypothetical protein